LEEPGQPVDIVVATLERRIRDPPGEGFPRGALQFQDQLEHPPQQGREVGQVSLGNILQDLLPPGSPKDLQVAGPAQELRQDLADLSRFGAEHELTGPGEVGGH
jgi:hypothetical protein